MISAAGAGGLIVAVIMPVALYVAVDNGIPVLMMSLVTMGGIMVGGLSPLAINGIVASQLSAEQGITNYNPLWAAYAVSMTIFSLGAYLLLGGLKCKKMTTTPEFVSLTRTRPSPWWPSWPLWSAWCSSAWTSAWCSFTCAGILLMLNVADQKKAIAAIPGHHPADRRHGCADQRGRRPAAALISERQALQRDGSLPAQPIFVILGGLMGAVSSGTGVVMPTLIPPGL